MDALKKAPSPFTTGVLAGAFVCLASGAPWPLAGCLILAAASHVLDLVDSLKPAPERPLTPEEEQFANRLIAAMARLEGRAIPDPLPTKSELDQLAEYRNRPRPL